MIRPLAVGLGIAAATGWVGYAWGAHLVPGAGVRRGGRHRRRVALTFDDGPDSGFTPRVLDILAVRGVSASFFLVGDRARRAPGVVRAMAAAGHDVGNHGWSHRSLWLCGPRQTAREIERGQELLADLAGRSPRYFRPPWGMVNAAMFGVLRQNRLRCVLWSIQPEGLRPAPAAQQAAYVVSRAHAGAIVDLHDAEGTPGAPERLCAALPPMIDGLRAAGYELVTLPTLLDGPEPAPRGVTSATPAPPRPR